MTQEALKQMYQLLLTEPHAPTVCAQLERIAREALAQPEQEPVAWGVFEGNLHDMFFTQSEAQEMAKLKGTHAEVRPLYATPKRTCVGLTDEEMKKIWYAMQNIMGWYSFQEIARAIEAAHGIGEKTDAP